MNYAIFRSEPIYTLQDLAQIGSHNKREKRAYNSNPNIKLELTKNNVELKPLAEKYVKGFYNITKDYRKEHEEKMKTERADRKKTFNQMLNLSNNVVADELLFTASNDFFKNMTKENIIKWANTCMDFVYQDLGYKKEQILHATLHMDELTPHVHCVVIPLIKKYDKRAKKEKYTISKKHYIKDKNHLSQLQDKYYERLINAGFDLERGIKGSDAEHLKIKELKKATRYYETKVKTINDKIDSSLKEFNNNMANTKEIPFNKSHVLVDKNTFNSMKKVIKETKNAIELQPKIEELFSEVDKYTKSHQVLEKENNKLIRENKSLKTRNHNLIEDNKSLKYCIRLIFETIKKFFRKLLLIGNEPTKEATTTEIKEIYAEFEEFKQTDIYDVAVNTSKEQELFNYAGIKTNNDSSSDNKEDEKEDELYL